MARMGKQEKEEWTFFMSELGRRKYNDLCRKCVHDCKQSFRAMIIHCPKYKSKRSAA